MAKKMAAKIARNDSEKHSNTKTLYHDENKSQDYLFQMSHAPAIEESSHWFQMIPAVIFTALIIMIVYMKSYVRPMSKFFWSGGENNLVDFFSYYKMEAIIICTIFALILLSYRVFTQTLFIKRSYAYIPMLVYSIFVLLSYVFSDYQLFALWGWNERFEGTLPLLGYMVLLFYIINTVNTEKNVKLIIYPVAVTSSLLGVLGLSQALDHDFLRTDLGRKLMTPSWFWDRSDTLSFTFQNKEIYQTVYNINYVSFYLTLLIPLFGMIFIRSINQGKEEYLWKKIIWGLLFALLVLNLIGSASSGGLLGMAAAILVGIIVLNKKLIEWKKPVIALLIITVIIGGASVQRWLPELAHAVNGVFSAQNDSQFEQEESVESNGISRHKVNYIETSGQDIIMGYDGNELTFHTYDNDPTALQIDDNNNKTLSIVPTNVSPMYRIDDKRFSQITVRPAQDDKGNNYIVIGTDGYEWPFQLSQEGPKYYTGLGKLVDLNKVPSVGWKNNPSFGSGRGYIWSRTIPMMKDTVLLGHGADTYCIYFPHNDFVGKYNSISFTSNINILVDKPHNMYFGAFIGTGGISVIALVILWGMYIIQSFKLYIHVRFKKYIEYIGAGIFLGISGFLISGMVNDSSVSVMPMFYGLLGTGISINAIIKKQALSE